MKKIFRTALITGLFFVGMSGAAQADSLTLAEIGGVDTLLAQTNLINAAEGTELAWVNKALAELGFGTGFTFAFKDDELAGEWFNISELTGVFAHELEKSPDYFLIKTGSNTGNPLGNQWFLFANLNSINWAVINLEEMGFSNILNIQKVSHIGEYQTPVPEPATMLLLGTGLAGLFGLRRRKKS